MNAHNFSLASKQLMYSAQPIPHEIDTTHSCEHRVWVTKAVATLILI